MKTIIYTFLLLCFSTISYGQTNETLFNIGNDLYNKGNYDAAIQKYNAILKSGNHSPEVYYNMANAYYKLNKTAETNYYFEKAKQLNPNDADIKNNLIFAKNMTIDVIEKLPELSFYKTKRNIINTYSFDTWAIMAIAFMFIAALLFIIYYFIYNTSHKRLAFIGSIFSFTTAILALFFAFQKYSFDVNNNPAIVFAKETDVLSDPKLSSETLFTLHEGTKVQVIENYKNEWQKIKLVDGKTGWMPSNTIKLLSEPF